MVKRYLLSIGVALSLFSSTYAAAPNVTYLFPAGAGRGSTAEVTATGTFDVWPTKVWVSGNGVSAVAGRTKGTLSVTVDKAAEPGVYFLRCHDEQGGGNLRPFIVGTLPELNETEPNDDAKQPQKIERSSVVNGRLQKNGDVDCFALSLKKGQTLVASLRANQILKSPMDAVLQVVSADGFVLDQNHDYLGLDPQVVYEIPKDGTYNVRVFAFPAMPDSGIRFAGGEDYIYRLTLTSGGFVDHVLPLATQRDKSDTVTLTGWNIPVDLARVKVEKENVFHPQFANTGRVRLEPHATFDATAKQPDSLIVPFTVTGRIDKPRSANTFTFAAKKGQSLFVEVESATLGFPLVPVLRVLDSAGKQLARAEPAQLYKDVSLTFNPTADGNYRVEVRDQNGDGSARHVYRLRVVRPEPDFTLKLTTDRFVLPANQPVTLTPVATKLNGFNQDITLTVENLPQGIAAKVDKMNVVLTAAKAGISGAIHIVGQARDVKRLVVVDLADVGTSHAELWITSTAGKK